MWLEQTLLVHLCEGVTEICGAVHGHRLLQTHLFCAYLFHSTQDISLFPLSTQKQPPALASEQRLLLFKKWIIPFNLHRTLYKSHSDHLLLCYIVITSKTRNWNQGYFRAITGTETWHLYEAQMERCHAPNIENDEWVERKPYTAMKQVDSAGSSILWRDGLRWQLVLMTNVIYCEGFNDHQSVQI